MNSDVIVFFVDILPRIKPGVVIHIHDVKLPYDYPDAYKEWSWNEQYLLAVYLTASVENVIPLLPTACICRNEKLRALISSKHVSFGSTQRDASWFGGGSFGLPRIDDFQLILCTIKHILLRKRLKI
jgi:hypothetical protein